MHSSSMLLPGDNGLTIIGAVVREGFKALSKSAIKAAKRKAKNQRRVEGNARKKARNTQGGAGKWQLTSC